LIICTGLFLVFTRVGVGAHHPIDVLVGSIVGFISGLIGIFMSRKFYIWTWIANKKYYPLFILLFLICSIFLITKIVQENLFIYYFTLLVLIVSLYKIVYVYIKK
jgi:H+/Cl- antiporter ClcA